VHFDRNLCGRILAKSHPHAGETGNFFNRPGNHPEKPQKSAIPVLPMPRYQPATLPV
jgi:hypothetical protein